MCIVKCADEYRVTLILVVDVEHPSIMRTNEGYSNFINSLRNQTAFVGGPFDTPPAPIRGNLKNVTTGKEAFGYFIAGGISANAGFVPEEVLEEGCGI